jgi:hypothetical protein
MRRNPLEVGEIGIFFFGIINAGFWIMTIFLFLQGRMYLTAIWIDLAALIPSIELGRALILPLLAMTAFAGSLGFFELNQQYKIQKFTMFMPFIQYGSVFFLVCASITYLLSGLFFELFALLSRLYIFFMELGLLLIGGMLILGAVTVQTLGGMPGKTPLGKDLINFDAFLLYIIGISHVLFPLITMPILFLPPELTVAYYSGILSVLRYPLMVLINPIYWFIPAGFLAGNGWLTSKLFFAFSTSSIS